MGEEIIKVRSYSCERCGHKWLPRNEEKPTICPSCKSAYWDKPRKSEGEK